MGRSHRYFVDWPTYTGGAVRELPDHWVPTELAEFRYPYDVLKAALPHVKAEGLHFYFTKNAYALPEYGPHVVAILMQEERCKVPVYGRHVRATIRNLPSRPFLGFRPHRRIGKLECVLTIEYLRDWYTHFMSLRAQASPPASWGAPIRVEPAVIRLALGYHSQEELTQVPMSKRTLDAFFAGQISHAVPRNDIRYWISSSKFAAREQLWRELERLEKQRRWNLDLGKIAATHDFNPTPAFSNYSEKMMHTRICVAPRGSTAETYRAFEGLRAGCLVVTNRLPQEPLWDKAPLLQVDHWRQFEGILKKFARSIDLLEDARAKAIAWWESRLAPSVCGLQLAAELNRAGDTLEPSA